MQSTPPYQQLNHIINLPEWSDGGRHSGTSILKAALNNTNFLPYILSASVYRRSALMAVMKRAPAMVRNREFGIEDVPVIAALASEGDALHFPAVTLEYVQCEESISNSRQLEKQIRFYCHSILCSHTLGRYYGLEEKDLADHFRTKSLFLAANAFNSGNPAMRDMTAGALKVWHLALPAKARIHLLLMRNRLIWKVAKALKLKIGLGKD